MKYIRFISLILLSVLCFMSCDKDTSHRAFMETQVTIVKSDVNFACEGGTGEILVDTGGEAVTATSNQTWCTTAVSGQTIKVTVGENYSLLSRSALITLRSGDKVNYVPVSQGPLIIKLEARELKAFGYAHTQTVAYSCAIPISVASDQSWLEASVSDGNIVLAIEESTEISSSRSAKVSVTAGSVSEVLSVSQNPKEPAPDVETVNAFLNLKNNNGTSSRYRISEFSPDLDKYYQALKTKFPIIEEMRIEAPRSTYKLSIIMRHNNSTTYYWNATNGLVPVNGSKSVAAFVFSGNSYAGSLPAYDTDATHTEFRAIFASANGFTILQEGENAFWFRSEANPLYYFKAEATTW
ncbi:MAG: hypothetical protein LBR57_02695 [Alistipes sp.]|jgi:hypothetical protein|nr:hypothetical protein [Alistipes sp.]